jgi:polyphosphate glucokinase
MCPLRPIQRRNKPSRLAKLAAPALFRLSPAMATKNDTAAPSAKTPTARAAGAITLAIDIGGTGLKASLLDKEGEMVTERVRVDTPPNLPPPQMVDTLAKLVAPLTGYARVSVGFPGVVRRGKIVTAPNLGTDLWKGFDLDLALTERLGKPVRVLNDADVQGLGAISGVGVEMVITLGTGLGSSLFEDGRSAPHLEFAHHPFRKKQTYEQQLGKAALKEVGKETWNHRVSKAIKTLRILTNFDHLYIGGGNARLVGFELPPDVSLVSNELGMRGGIWLWKDRSPGSTDIFRRQERGR